MFYSNGGRSHAVAGYYSTVLAVQETQNFADKDLETPSPEPTLEPMPEPEPQHDFIVSLVSITEVDLKWSLHLLGGALQLRRQQPLAAARAAAHHCGG